jgi:hypothetical protein
MKAIGVAALLAAFVLSNAVAQQDTPEHAPDVDTELTEEELMYQLAEAVSLAVNSERDFDLSAPFNADDQPTEHAPDTDTEPTPTVAPVTAPAAEPVTPPVTKPEAPAPAAQAPAQPPAVAPPAPQPPVPKLPDVELRLHDGRTIKGSLVAQDELTVTIKVAGIATPFERSLINRLRTLPTVDEQYKSLRQRVKDLDFVERLKIADWLRTEERFDIALAEVDGVLGLDPGNPTAEKLRTQILLEHDLATRRQAPNAAPKPKPKPAAANTEFPLLTDEQINLMRVFEVDLAANPRLAVTRETIQRFMETYAGREGMPTTREAKDAFLRKPASEILQIMFRLRAREFYGDVKVMDHPTAIRNFRDDVHNAWILNTCATTACHGGEESGKLRLANKGIPPDRVVYTNLLILDRFRMKDGRALINYEHPAESPLLQMALPRGDTATPHPDVMVGKNKVRWRPVLTSTDDPRYRKVIAWIESMYKPRQDYPIDYAPPEGKPFDSGR